MAHAARYNTYRLPIVQRPFGHPNDNSIRMIFAWRRPKCDALLINEARPACEHTTHSTPTVYTRMCSGLPDIIRFWAQGGTRQQAYFFWSARADAVPAL